MGSLNSSSIQIRKMPWVKLHRIFVLHLRTSRVFSSDVWMLNSGDASNLGLAREQHPQLGEKRCEGQSRGWLRRHALNAKAFFNLSCTRIMYCTWCIRLIYFEPRGSCGAFSKGWNYPKDSTVSSSPAPWPLLQQSKPSWRCWWAGCTCSWFAVRLGEVAFHGFSHLNMTCFQSATWWLGRFAHVTFEVEATWPAFLASETKHVMSDAAVSGYGWKVADMRYRYHESPPCLYGIILIAPGLLQVEPDR